MKVYVKRYEELTKDELYALVRLRIAVFVVEQNCPYMELDGRIKPLFMYGWKMMKV